MGLQGRHRAFNLWGRMLKDSTVSEIQLVNAVPAGSRIVREASAFTMFPQSHSAGGVAIAVVHGTWAGEASWTKADSPFCRTLNDANVVDIAPFRWSGRNSSAERLRASQDLAQWLKQRFLRWPDCAHFVVAHSHGGNVAILAALHDDVVRNELKGIACLSTPFLHFRERYLGPFGLVYLPYTCALTSMALGIWIARHAFGLDLGSLPFRYGALLFVAFTLPVLLIVQYVEKMIDGAVDTFRKATSLTGVDALNLLLVRSPGDEASGALATAQFLAWHASRAWAGISSLAGGSRFRTERLILPLVKSVLGSWSRQPFLVVALFVMGWLIRMAPPHIVNHPAVLVVVVFGLISDVASVLGLEPVHGTAPRPRPVASIWFLRALGILLVASVFVNVKLAWAMLALNVSFVLPAHARGIWRSLRAVTRPSIVAFWMLLMTVGVLSAAAVHTPYPALAVVAIPVALGYCHLIVRIAEALANISAVIVAPLCVMVLWFVTRFAYGIEAANVSLKLDVTAETMPAGTWTITQPPWSKDSGTMVHSLYNDERVAALIRNWVNNNGSAIN
jgi:hypothetical protein